MSENLDFGRNLQQILVLVEIFENFDFGRNFPEIVVFIVGVLSQFLWEAQAHKVSGRYIIGNC